MLKKSLCLLIVFTGILAVADTYCFETDAMGHVTRMVLHIRGKDIPLGRIESTTP